MTITTSNNIPDLKTIQASIKKLDKSSVTLLAQANDCAVSALLYAMLHNDGTTQDISAMNTLVGTLERFDHVNMASRLKKWITACAPCWVWKSATKAKAATFKKVTVNKKGNKIPFEFSEEILNVPFYSWKPEKNDEVKPFTEDQLKRALGNLKAKATEKGLDFKHTVDALLTEQSVAATPGVTKSLTTLIPGSRGKGRTPKKSEQTEQQADTAQATEAETVTEEEITIVEPEIVPVAA